MAVLKLGTVLFLMLLTTLSLAKDVPDAPLPPDIACHPTERKATVSWKAPKDNGSPITSYDITVWDGLQINFSQMKTIFSKFKTSTEVSLDVWATFTFQVAARNSIGQSPNSELSVPCVPPPNVPESNPHRPRARLTHTNNLVITWIKMIRQMHNGPGFFYRVYYKKASDTEWKNVTVNNWEEEETRIRLNQNTTEKYEIKVEANNAIGAAKTPPEILIVSSPTADFPDAPLPPEIACHPTERKATVSWKTPNNNGSPINGYDITASNSVTSNLDKTTFLGTEDSTSTHVSLDGFANYTFRVAARNSIGMGPKSEPSVPCEMPSDVPERNPVRPRGQLTLTNDLVITWIIHDDGFQITLNCFICMSYGCSSTNESYINWSVDVDKIGIEMHNGPGFFYRVYYRKASDLEWKNVTVSNWGDEKTTVSLSPSTDAKYEIKVEANNAIGAAKQLPRIVIASSPYADIPSTPLPPDVHCNTETRTATVTWMAPNDNGSPLETYVIEGTALHINHGSTYIYNAEDGNNKTFNLIPGASYIFKVQAINSIGRSSFSGNSTLCESSPDVPPRNPKHVRGRITETDELVINWSYMASWYANGPGFFYRVYFKKLSDDKWKHFTIDDWRKRETQISVTRDETGRIPRYEVKVEANNDVGASKIPPVIITVKSTSAPPDVPSTPLRPDVQCQPENRTATLSWKAPEDNDSPITSYFITISKSNTSNVDTTTFHDPANGTIKEFHLRPGAKYSFRVTAHNAIGLSHKSEHSLSCEEPPDVPYDNPTDIHGRVTDTSDLDIKWKKMARDLHNGPGFFYRVYYKKVLDTTWTNVTVLNWEDEETKVNLNGEMVERHAKYEVKVEANNAIGAAKKTPESFVLSSFDADVPSTPFPPIIECAPEERKATVTWKAPADNGSPIITYAINRNNSYDSISVRTSFYDAKDGTSRVFQVNPGPKYSFRIRAINSIGQSSYSEYSAPCEAAPDVPYRNPSAVYGYVTETDNLVIKWESMRSLEHNGPGFFYRVYFKKTTDQVWQNATINDWNRIETRIDISRESDLELTTYEVKVEANNKLGPASEPPKAFIVQKGKPQVPNSPLNVHVECNLMERQAIVRWNVPKDNGAAILGYSVKVINVDNPEALDIIWNCVAEKTHQEIHVDPGIKYTFQVSARGLAGNSVPVERNISCSVNPEVPFDNPSDVLIQGTKPNKLLVTWKPMDFKYLNGPGFFYRVYFKASSEKQWRNVTIADFKVGVAKINLDDNIDIKFQKYDIKVEANNILGPAKKQPRLFTGYNGEAKPLKAPGNFTLVKLDSNKTASFSWSPVPEDSVRGHFAGYMVTCWSEKQWSREPIVVNVTADATRVTIYRLQPGATNFVHVQAMNHLFAGPPSNVVAIDLPEIPPGPVSHLDIVQMGATTLGLRRGRPSEPNGTVSLRV